MIKLVLTAPSLLIIPFTFLSSYLTKKISKRSVVLIGLAIYVISDHFQGKEQVKMMGYNTAFSNLGGIITMLLAGYLATFNWRIPFNVYWIGLIIFLLVLFFLPKDKPITSTAGSSQTALF